MSVPGPLDLEFVFDQVKKRAEIRLLWLVGRIGNPKPWCRYCSIVIHGEYVWEIERQEHNPGCPVPEALWRFSPDFDGLVAEVDRLRGERSQ
jgi:hypothetical protein